MRSRRAFVTPAFFFSHHPKPETAVKRKQAALSLKCSAPLRNLTPPHPVTVPTSLKSWSETILCTLGFALSFHLGLLKQFSLPCVGAGGCHSIIHSGYGSLFGLPVGYYGALFWGAAIIIPDRTKRGALLALLASGALVFMGIQFFVLKGFCLYCTIHAVVAWIAVFLHGEEPKKWALPVGLLLALGGFQLARVRVGTQPVALLSEGAMTLAEAPSGAAWLAPLTPHSPALILSLNCAACVDVLDEIARHNFKNVRTGPAIFFKVTDENRALTTTFVAAVLAQAAATDSASKINLANDPSKRDAFLATTALYLSIRDLALSSPQAAGEQLAHLVPAAAGQHDNAVKLLDAQTQALAAVHLGQTTPLLVPISSRPRPYFKTTELFGGR